MPEILVLGVGNVLLTDDGVGVHAVRELVRESWPDTVTLLDAGTFTQDAFYLFKTCGTLLVLDSVRAGGRPGTLYRLTEGHLVQKRSLRLSIHDIDLLDSLRMAEHMYGARPEMLIVGMEPANHTTWSMELSPAARSAFPGFVELARREIRRISGMA
ncbi:MAG: HyaD/HybD family hydrogenase maturation endopeptidase [Desulfovibrionaceae bacterium]|nr:HyaD/HybD family hydrogenase maturation endopeptidase [Desulfovibrionaceae bacterium]